MKIENLIKIVQDLLDVNAVDFSFQVYDSLKMDNVELDVNKVNGLARIATGSIDPISNLGQSSVTMVVEFIYPYERLEAVRQTLLNVSQNSAGLVVANNTLDPSLTGSTGVLIAYPTQGNYFNGTMGETVRSRLFCYFDINEKSVLSNDIKLSIMNGYAQAESLFKGKYYTYSGHSYNQVTLPEDYNPMATYYKTKIPEEYQELSYVYNYGTAFFVLPIKNNLGLTYEITFTPKINSNGTYALMGLDTDLINGLGIYISTTNNSIGFWYKSFIFNKLAVDNVWTNDVQIKVKCEFYNGVQRLYINDSLVLTGNFTGDIQESKNIILLNNGSSLMSGVQCDLVEAKILKGDYLLGWYVPCEQVETSNLGIYDIVTKQFIEKDHGILVAGSNVSNMVEANSQLISSQANKYYILENNQYSEVILPKDFVSETHYYTINWEDIPYYKYVITRHRLSTTNKYNNNKEMQTVNDGQSIDFSLAVPSIKGSVINSIKDDMLSGDNIGKTFNFKIVDEAGENAPKYFNNMIASGDFSYEIVPGQVLLMKILFVYKRVKGS